MTLLTCSFMGTNTGGAGRGRDGAGGPRLTSRRRKIIRVIDESVRSRGYPPSLREIGEAVGLASTSSFSHQMQVLKAMGYVNREVGRPRTATLRLPGQDGDAVPAPGDGRTVEIPLVGRIAAGVPVIADQVAEQAEDVIALPRMLTGEGSLIALRVDGDSMTGAAIADGDWVVVRQQPDAGNGDVVAAMLPAEASADWEATVKTLKKADGHAWLIPHNPAYTPILADTAIIIGKVVSVLRRLLRPGWHGDDGRCQPTAGTPCEGAPAQRFQGMCGAREGLLPAAAGLGLLGQGSLSMHPGALHAHLGELGADSEHRRDLLVRLLGEGSLERGLVRDEQLAGEEVRFLFLLLVDLPAAVVGEQDVVELVLQEMMAQLVGHAGASPGQGVARVLQNEPPGADRDQGCGPDG